MFCSCLFSCSFNGPNQKSVSDVKVYPQNLSDKTLILKKKNAGKNKSPSGRFPVSFTAPGGAGPVRIMARDGDTVSEMVNIALMLNGLPQITFDPANAGSDTGKVTGYANMKVDGEGKKIATNGFFVAVSFPPSSSRILVVVGESDTGSEVLAAARKLHANAGFEGSQICKKERKGISKGWKAWFNK